MPAALGIDLGLTYSCIASIQGKLEVIANGGHRTTPSCVAFVYGDEKEAGSVVRLPDGATDKSRRARTRIGRSYSEQSVLKGLKRWSINRANSSAGSSMRTSHLGQTKKFSSRQVAAMVLRKLKAHAEDLLGQKVTAAVIAIPSYFTDSQRRATREACELAGLKVLRLVPESTAATLAYGLDRKIAGDKQVLIFDLGGGSFNVAVASRSGGRYVVRGLEGNSRTGKNELDELVGKFSAECGAQRPKICGACVDRLLSDGSPCVAIPGTVTPGESVAYGAALWAAHLSRHESALLPGPDEPTVAPLSVGIKVGLGVFRVLIPRNATVPVRKEVRLLTDLNRRSSVRIRVYQGERPVVKHNKYVGELVLRKLPSSRAGLGVDVALGLGVGGCLSVEAKAETCTEWQRCTLLLDEVAHSDVLNSLDDAVRYGDEDQMEVDRLWKRLQLQKYLINNGRTAPEECKTAFIATRKWFDEHPDAVIDEITSKLETLRMCVSCAATVNS